MQLSAFRANEGGKPIGANKVLALVSVGVFMTVLDLFIVNVAFPNIQRDFNGADLSRLSWILNGYAIVFAALLVPAGRIADRTGQKRVFITGLLLFTVASALCAVATGPETLTAARLIQAAGAAAVTPTSLSILLNAISADRRAWALGIWTAVGGTAAAAGPTIGGLLTSVSWRWVFLVNVPIGIAAILLSRVLLAEQKNDERGARPDMLGAGLLTLSVAALALGIVEGPEWGWESGRVATAFVVAALAVLAFVRQSARHGSPIIEPAIVKVPSFSIAAVGALLFNASFSILLLGLVQFFTDIWGYSALRVGLAISPGPLMVPFVAPRGYLLVKRLGATTVAFLGTSLFAAGGLWFLNAGQGEAYLTGILPGLLMTGIGFGLTLPILIGASVRSLPHERFATGSAVVTMARQIGTVLGVSVLIVLLKSGDGDLVNAIHHGWWAVAATSLATGVTVLALGVVTRGSTVKAARPVAVGAH